MGTSPSRHRKLKRGVEGGRRFSGQTGSRKASEIPLIQQAFTGHSVHVGGEVSAVLPTEGARRSQLSSGPRQTYTLLQRRGVFNPLIRGCLARRASGGGTGINPRPAGPVALRRHLEEAVGKQSPVDGAEADGSPQTPWTCPSQ